MLFQDRVQVHSALRKMCLTHYDFCARQVARAGGGTMEKWQCTVCKYVYNPEKGDPFGAAPGTRFEDLPDDWICPICGVSKDKYTPAPPDADYRKRRARKKS